MEGRWTREPPVHPNPVGGKRRKPRGECGVGCGDDRAEAAVQERSVDRCEDVGSVLVQRHGAEADVGVGPRRAGNEGRRRLIGLVRRDGPAESASGRGRGTAMGGRGRALRLRRDRSPLSGCSSGATTTTPAAAGVVLEHDVLVRQGSSMSSLSTWRLPERDLSLPRFRRTCELDHRKGRASCPRS